MDAKINAKNENDNLKISESLYLLQFMVFFF